jgi:proton-dependent oligopeptide transporter, POT family
MMINVGALIGGVAVPLTAQKDVRIAYFLPVISLATAIILFLAGTSRYIRSTPSSPFRDVLFGRKKKKSPPVYAINNTGDRIPLSTIVKVSLLVVPFNMYVWFSLFSSLSSRVKDPV